MGYGVVVKEGLPDPDKEVPALFGKQCQKANGIPSALLLEDRFLFFIDCFTGNSPFEKT